MTLTILSRPSGWKRCLQGILKQFSASTIGYITSNDLAVSSSEYIALGM